MCDAWACVVCVCVCVASFGVGDGARGWAKCRRDAPTETWMPIVRCSPARAGSFAASPSVSIVRAQCVAYNIITIAINRSSVADNIRHWFCSYKNTGTSYCYLRCGQELFGYMDRGKEKYNIINNKNSNKINDNNNNNNK